jgi:hypothetical protein
MGVVAIILYPDTTAKVPAAKAALVGAASGIVFWGATRLFVIVADHWAFFRKAVAAAYGQASDTPLARELLLSLLLAVPGEELFWRGLFQQQLGEALGGNAALSAALAWIAFVAANVPSANLAIVAGAVTGGALWVGLGWWCGGVAAPLASHLAWTGLMLAFPVVRVEAVE